MLVRRNRVLPSFPILLSPAKAKYGLTARTKPVLTPSCARGPASSQAGGAGPASLCTQPGRREGLLSGWAGT